MSYKRIAFALILLLTSCKKPSPNGQAVLLRTAVLRFENLSGTVASANVEWQGRALSELLKRSLHAESFHRSGSNAPGLSTERLAALESGATRLIYGYYVEQPGGVFVTAVSENPATQKVSAPIHASGSLTAVAESLARQFGGTNATIAKTPPAALEQLSLAADSSGAAAISHYQGALQADPDSAVAYLGLIQTALSINDLPTAQSALAQAISREANFTAQDRADLELQRATLTGDMPARLHALSAELALNRQNPEILLSLADAETSLRRSSDAARHLREFIALAPEDANARNLLSYACLSSGDETGARSAAAEYRRLRPLDPNAFDTQGDVELAFGHFAEAEAFYLASPDPEFQNFSPTWKAAYARLHTGDVAAATKLFDRHAQLLAHASSPIAPYRDAEWQFQIGHHAEAIVRMSAFAAQATQPTIHAVALTQAAIWAILSHDDPKAIEWSSAALRLNEKAVFVPAALARFLAQPAAPPAVWKQRAESDFKGANAAGLQRLALGLALVYSNYPADALPVWKQLYDSSPASDALPMYLYGWCLLQTGHTAEARPLLRLTPIPASTFVPTFEALYIPAWSGWRAASLRQ